MQREVKKRRLHRGRRWTPGRRGAPISYVAVRAKTVLEAFCELAGLILAVAGVLALLYVDRAGGWLLAVGFWISGALLITLSRSLRDASERE